MPWLTAVCLLVFPVLAAGQSLGDAAKKEEARREKVRQAGGRAKTFTQDDLSSTTGRVANDPSEPAAKGEAASPTTGASPAPGTARSPRRSSAEVAADDAEAFWRARVGAARARAEIARQRNDDLQRMIHLGQPAMYDQNGRRVMLSLQQMKALADAAAAELATAEKALESLLDEARRSGALPGWLR